MNKFKMMKFTDPELVDSKNDSTCRICSKVFSNKYVKERHHKDVHLKLKNFQCQHCNYKCGRKGILNRHYKDVHLKIRNFKCPYCSQRCAHKSDLQTHINAMHKYKI